MATNLINLSSLRLIPAIAILCFTLGCSAAPQNAEAKNLAPDSSAKSKKTAPIAKTQPTTPTTPTSNDVAAADLGRIQGDAKAPVWVIVMSDFQCPVCKAWHDQVYGDFFKEYIAAGKVRFAYVNYPLRRHQHSFEAAEAAMCSAVQGKFWQMQGQLFNTQETWSEMPSIDTYFAQLAQKSGVDMTKYRSCVQNHTTRALIQADYDRGTQAGVDGTPTIFVNNRMLPTLAPDDLREAINRALSGK